MLPSGIILSSLISWSTLDKQLHNFSLKMLSKFMRQFATILKLKVLAFFHLKINTKPLYMLNWQLNKSSKLHSNTWKTCPKFWNYFYMGGRIEFSLSLLSMRRLFIIAISISSMLSMRKNWNNLTVNIMDNLATTFNKDSYLILRVASIHYICSINSILTLKLQFINTYRCWKEHFDVNIAVDFDYYNYSLAFCLNILGKSQNSIR